MRCYEKKYEGIGITKETGGFTKAWSVLREWAGMNQTELEGIIIADRAPRTLGWETAWGVRGTEMSVGLEHKYQNKTWGELRLERLAEAQLHGTL